eukprot:m.144818 g.144818  ORF g.144818 m.144818 type:complete len:248 (+) comp17206_c0_seq1:1520-2263(+)
MRVASSTHNILSLQFNLDNTGIAIGTRHGYRMFQCDPFTLVNEHVSDTCEHGASLAVMLNRTLLIHVGSGEHVRSSQRCLRIFNPEHNKEIIRLNFTTAIVAVKLTRTRLVVVLETHIYVYNIHRMEVLHEIAGTPKNPLGICALAAGEGDGSTAGFFAFPGSVSAGEVNLYDVNSLKPVTLIQAHQSPLRCLALSNDGSKVATASIKARQSKKGQCQCCLKRVRDTMLCLCCPKRHLAARPTWVLL